MTGDFNGPELFFEVTVCGSESLFVHTTVLPTLTLSAPGAKAKFSIDTAVDPAGSEAAGGDPLDAAGGADVAGGVLPQAVSTKSNATTTPIPTRIPIRPLFTHDAIRRIRTSP
jgi:hypothetical protein